MGNLLLHITIGKANLTELATSAVPTKKGNGAMLYFYPTGSHWSSGLEIS